MPPRPPPPPGPLTILCTLAAGLAAWVGAAIAATGHALVGSAAGVPILGFSLPTEQPWLLSVNAGPVPGGPGPLAQALAVVGGAGLLLLVALALHGLVGIVRTSGATRAIALQLLAVAVLWFPSALAAAALPGGGGPVAGLYASLGAPEAGRWASLPLALLLLVLGSGFLAARAVATGRNWIRADSLIFRHRLVRVVVGYPACVALGALMVLDGWAGVVLTLLWAGVILITLRIRTV